MTMQPQGAEIHVAASATWILVSHLTPIELVNPCGCRSERMLGCRLFDICD